MKSFYKWIDHEIDALAETKNISDLLQLLSWSLKSAEHMPTCTKRWWLWWRLCTEIIQHTPKNCLALLPHHYSYAAFCQSVMATCLHPLSETVHTKRNFNVESRCWWGRNCDCLWCCRDALRWTKRALNASEGAAVCVGGASWNKHWSTRSGVWMLFGVTWGVL